MQFFLLILFNVFMGAVLYLIISLKLERSATEFRERRLRREMERIIHEFNVTAERNITMLENRIAALKKVMALSGDIKSLDIVVDEPGIYSNKGSAPAGKTSERGDAEEKPTLTEKKPDDYDDFGNNGATTLKKGLLLIFEKIINILPGSGHRDAVRYMGGDAGCDGPSGHAALVSDGGMTLLPERSALIEKDLSHVLPETASPCVCERPLTEDEISEIVSSAEDKYSMVAVLFERGCGIDEISRYSGIPAGEVRLVLNLNSSR